MLSMSDVDGSRDRGCAVDELGLEEYIRVVEHAVFERDDDELKPRLRIPF